MVAYENSIVPAAFRAGRPRRLQFRSNPKFSSNIGMGAAVIALDLKQLPVFDEFRKDGTRACDRSGHVHLVAH
jgi:hypothetical protein